MSIVSQRGSKNSGQLLEPMVIQARLAKDGSDDDIKEALSEEAIRRANVKDRTERIKQLIRLGMLVESDQVLNENDTLIFDGHDLAEAKDCIVAQIGSNTIILPVK